MLSPGIYSHYGYIAEQLKALEGWAAHVQAAAIGEAVAALRAADCTNGARKRRASQAQGYIIGAGGGYGTTSDVNTLLQLSPNW